MSAFDGRIRPDRVGPEVAELRQRRRVEGRRAHAGHAEPLEPRAHLARRLVGERDREDLRRRERARGDLVRDPVRDRRRLARARARRGCRPARGRPRPPAAARRSAPPDHPTEPVRRRLCRNRASVADRQRRRGRSRERRRRAAGSRAGRSCHLLRLRVDPDHLAARLADAPRRSRRRWRSPRAGRSRPSVSIFEPSSGTRVIEPLPAFATQAAPKPIATATGSVPTTSLAEDAPRHRVRSRSAVAIGRRPSRRARRRGRPRGGCGRRRRAGCASVVQRLRIQHEQRVRLDARGAPPITKRRSSAAATIPPTKISAERDASRLRVQRVGCRADVPSSRRGLRRRLRQHAAAPSSSPRASRRAPASRCRRPGARARRARRRARRRRSAAA